MTAPTPRSAAPGDVRRARLVEETIAGLEGSDELPIDEQLALLDQAQRTLSAVLSNDPSIAQPGLPEVAG